MKKIIPPPVRNTSVILFFDKDMKRLTGPVPEAKYVTKKYHKRWAMFFENEIYWLKKFANFDRVPDLIDVDPENLKLTMTFKGKNILTETLPINWEKQLAYISGVLEQYDFKHNDISMPEVLIQDGKINIVDFQISTEGHRDLLLQMTKTMQRGNSSSTNLEEFTRVCRKSFAYQVWKCQNREGLFNYDFNVFATEGSVPTIFINWLLNMFESPDYISYSANTKKVISHQTPGDQKVNEACISQLVLSHPDDIMLSHGALDEYKNLTLNRTLTDKENFSKYTYNIVLLANPYIHFQNIINISSKSGKKPDADSFAEMWCVMAKECLGLTDYIPIPKLFVDYGNFVRYGPYIRGIFGQLHLRKPLPDCVIKNPLHGLREKMHNPHPEMLKLLQNERVALFSDQIYQ